MQAAAPSVQRKRPLALKVLVACALVLVVAGVAGAIIDGLLNGDRIYQGISIGEVDVSGMTRDEAAQAVEARYADQVNAAIGFIFASEDDVASIDIERALTESDAQAEQLSVEEARANQQLWVADAGSLGARVPVSALVDAAFDIGRVGGIVERMEAARDGAQVPATVTFDEEALEALALSIDESTGDPRVDYDVTVEDGQASVVEGHSGTAVDRSGLRQGLIDGFLGPASAAFTLVAVPQEAPLRIDAQQAEKVRSQIQAALDRGCTFTFESASWTLGAEELGPWVRTEVEEAEGGYALVPFFDESEATSSLLALIRDAGFASGATVSFTEEGGEIWVSTKAGSSYPHVANAVLQADAALFGEGALEVETPSVAIEWGEAPSKVSFDEALDLGLIGAISSYTTEYNDSPSTANRRHNIHTAADLLNNSIAKADGGEWSFNATVGEATEEAGFQAAHAIVNGEYDDAIGGGICQVATTVFNAVYEAGFPVTQRRNHSLYISSYPTGRDAAIAYPTLDLTWVNDSTSDVLMRARYTDSTLTVTLYGVDPGYVVSTQTGDWEAGEPFKKKTKVDESEPEGTRYVKTAGADGRKVTVHRVVRDRAGNILHEEDFTSNYAPIDEVTVVGPNTPTENDKEEDKSNDKEEEEARVLPAGD